MCLEDERPENCNVCPQNRGFKEGSGRIAGPCGQQNCWYGCTVCLYNGMANKDCPLNKQ